MWNYFLSINWRGIGMLWVIIMCHHTYANAQSKEGSNIYFRFKEAPKKLSVESEKQLTKELITQQKGVRRIGDIQQRGSHKSARLAGPNSKFLKGIQLIELDQGADEQELLAYLKSFKNVEEVVIEPQVQILYTPNDPDLTTQDHLALVQAYEAWDVTNGNPEVVIGISDTGVDYDHEDLATNRYFNIFDPVNGIDDDGNGYIDDYIGFDLADDDDDPYPDTDHHGSLVAGVAAASTDNEIGIAGTGFNTSYFPIKVFESGTNLSRGTYESIVYAADLGLDVINLSWGGVNEYSQILQDMINYAVLEKDLVVIAAAGNTDEELQFFPASYDHVLSVGASNDNDEKADFATYSFKIDLMAPGQGIYSTSNNDEYGSGIGSSFAAPMVAGTAALVRDLFPELNAVQVMERIRMTSDDIYGVANNADYLGQLGKGRLNMLRAVSEENVAALRNTHFDYAGPHEKELFYGDTVTVSLKFANVLRTTDGMEVNVATISPYAEVLNGQIVIGAMEAFDSTDVREVKILLSENTPPDERLLFRMNYSDQLGYQDFEYFEFSTSPSAIIFGNSVVGLKIDSNGELGKTVPSVTELGMTFNGQRTANFMGILVGSHEDSISDNLNLNFSDFEKDDDFQMTTNLKKYAHDSVDHYTRNLLNDSLAENINGYLIEQEFLAWEDQGYQDFLITEYYLTNVSNNKRRDVRFGVYADNTLGISERNFIEWDVENKLGYAYSAATDGLMTGLAIISDHESNIYAIDLFDDIGEPIDIDSTLTDAFKYEFMNTEKLTAGGAEGQNVAMMLSAKMDSLPALTSQKIAYAYVFGYSLEELILNVDKAKAKYESFLAAPSLNRTLASCNTLTIELNNANEVALFRDPMGEDLIDQGEYLTIPPLAADSSFFYKELTGGYASDIYRMDIDITNPNIQFRTDPEVLYLEDNPNNRVQFVDESLGAVEWSWDFGNGFFSTLKNPKTTFEAEGNYEVNLAITSTVGCQDAYSQVFEVKTRGEAPILEDQIVCVGESVILFASNSSELNFYYNASDEDAFHSGEQYESEPVFEDMVIYVSSALGTEESIKVPVEVSVDGIAAGFNYIQDTLDMTASQLMSIQDQSENAVDYDWVVDGNPIDAADNWTIDYSGLSELDIKQIVTSNLGCEDSLHLVVPLQESIRPGISEEYVCKWGSITAQPLFGEKFVFYQDAELKIILAKGSQTTFDQIISDTIFYVTNISDFTESERVMFSVKLFDHDPQIVASPDSLELSQSIFAGFDTNSNDIIGYSWFINDVFFETASQPNISFDALGQYDIKLISQNSEGCIDTSNLVYSVYKVLSAESSFSELSLYPNPASETLYLKFSHDMEIDNIRLIDISGRSVVPLFEINENLISIDIKDISPGMFVFSYQVNGSLIQNKFYKK